MNYIEILEKFGIETNNVYKENMFREKIGNYVFTIADRRVPDATIYGVCQTIGFPISSIPRLFLVTTVEQFCLTILFPPHLRDVIDFRIFLARLNVLMQDNFFEKNTSLIDIVKEELNECKLPYKFCNGIIIPKGVKEFDKALVCDVAEWLADYRSAHKLYLTALQQ